MIHPYRIYFLIMLKVHSIGAPESHQIGTGRYARFIHTMFCLGIGHRSPLTPHYIPTPSLHTLTTYPPSNTTLHTHTPQNTSSLSA